MARGDMDGPAPAMVPALLDLDGNMDEDADSKSVITVSDSDDRGALEDLPYGEASVGASDVAQPKPTEMPEPKEKVYGLGLHAKCAPAKPPLPKKWITPWPPSHPPTPEQIQEYRQMCMRRGIMAALAIWGPFDFDDE